ncbi:ankyrin repeat-containing domain protein [Hypoxylon cercidicola]|nr:ankyrin repeat-containing domain protein [Hypoxylon cercidicola]
MLLEKFPNEIFQLIINHFVTAVGIYKAVCFRSVNKAFDAAIFHAICIVQVLDIDDPGTPKLSQRMPATLKGQILLIKSFSDQVNRDATLLAIARLNRILDGLAQATGEQQIRQHRIIAEAAAHWYPRCPWYNGGEEPEMNEQDILSGAVVLGDLRLVKTILEERSPAFANINVGSPYIGRPLQVAAAWGHTHIVRYLLDNGADPHLDQDDRDWEPNLHLPFALDGDPDRSPRGSALRVAVLNAHEDIIQSLLQPEHCISTSNVEYFYIIVAAGQIGHLGLVRTLMEATGKSLRDFPGLGEAMMQNAAYYDQLCVLQMLLDSGMDVNAEPITMGADFGNALYLAAQKGRSHIVRFLLERGADVNHILNHAGSGYEQAIGIAARGGFTEVVDILLAHGADPVKAFRCAADWGQAHLLKWLSMRDPQLHLKPWTDFHDEPVGVCALLRAIVNKNPAVITLLVDIGVPINYGAEDELPIYLAKNLAADWIVDLLLSLGAEDKEVDLRDRHEGYDEDDSGCMLRGEIRLSKRTWEWVGRY